MSRVRYCFASALILLLFGATNARAAGYGVVCPLFTLYVSGSGKFVECCHAYETSCDEIPDDIAWEWDDEPGLCDCPDTSGCLVGGAANAFMNTLPPILEKVSASGLPVGFSNKAVVVKSANVYVLKDGEPLYFRILHCVCDVDGRPDQTCAYSIGFEMKSPLRGIQGLTELQNCQSTDDPAVLKVPRGDRVIYLVRAALGASKKILRPAPTPATVPLQQASLNEPITTGAQPASIIKRPEAF